MIFKIPKNRFEINSFLMAVVPLLLLISLLPAENIKLFTFGSSVLAKTTSNSSSNKTHKSTRKIQMDTTAIYAQSMDIPQSTGPNWTLKRKAIVKDLVGYTVWEGTSENDPAENSTIMERNGKYTGTLHIKGKIFSIEPTDIIGEHLLIEKDFTTMGECGPRRIQ
jgi:hypothetical protein